MKYLKILFISFLFLSFANHVEATDDTSVQDLLGNTEPTTTAAPVAITKENPLGLDMPNQTDSPSEIITFTNPSQSGATVQLEIDSKGFVDITSPYSFPALSIGKHTLEFKYQDENAATQIYSSSIIIIPRAPIISTPSISNESITITGTGLANSELITVLSSGTIVSTQTSIVDGDGKWSVSFDRAELPNDIYSISAYIRRYGYASDLSEITKFTLDTSSSNGKSGEYLLDLSQLSFSVIKNWLINNQSYILTSFCALLLGIFIGLISKTQKLKQVTQRAEEKIAKEFQKKTSNNKEITLREKLAAAQEKQEAKQEPTNIEKPKEDSAVVNKLDFLKDYKKFDPDNAAGKEENEKVEVTLTSKK